MTQSIEIRVMRSRELHAYQPELNRLINEAYDGQDRSSYGTEKLFSGPRIESPVQLVDELGSAGLIAIAFDACQDDQGVSYLSKSEKPKCDTGIIPVAVAAVKPWKGKAVDLWDSQKTKPARTGIKSAIEDSDPTAGEVSEEQLDRNDWEVGICASRQSPRWRKQGLVTRCLDVLVERLQDSQHKEADVTAPPISLWMTILEGVGNVEYWQRRGFVRQGEPDQAPAGLWGAKRAFKVGTLRKTVI